MFLKVCSMEHYCASRAAEMSTYIYLKKLQLAQPIHVQRGIAGCLVKDEFGRMWKESVVA
jgi:hypothetical protein